jgi:uncharacterized protein
MNRLAIFILLFSLAVTAQTPKADHHQHLFSPEVATLIKLPPISGADVVRRLDEAGMEKALILSMGYTWGKPGRNVPNEYEMVKAENDFNSREAAKYPKRLVAFCGLNPMAPYAMQELERCAKDPNLRRGLKLHIGNSVVDYHNAEHVEKVRQIFAAANKRKMAIVIHARASFSQKFAYGAEETRVILEKWLPAAPDVPIQIAHLAGSGPGYSDSDPAIDPALSTFADAIEKKDPRTKRLYFDVASNVFKDSTPEAKQLIAKRLRQIGMKRILYGSDATVGDTPAPKEGWAIFRTLPLTEKEFKTIANNVPPYMK